MYKQLVYPDLTTVGNVGWCLSFVEDAYNTPHLGATATDAWHATQHPHQGNPPLDVQVPLWFSYIENGLDFGHVVVNVPGKGLLSSPYKQDGTQVWFSSITQCEAILNCHYLGWSEDLATVQLIVKESDMPNEGDVHNAYLTANGRKATAEEVKIYTNKSWGAEDGLYYGKVLVDLQNAKNNSSGDFKVLPPGKYKVNG